VEQGVVGAVQAQPSYDARLAGCWVRVDSAGTLLTFAYNAPADAARNAVVPLRFIGPVVTDVVGRAVAGRAVLPLAQTSERARRLTATAPPTNATTRMLPDSSYVAEFVDAMGRTEMSFTVVGDTLRGTLRRAAADVRYPLAPFRAERAECPR
jgi:hypothetical protein